MGREDELEILIRDKTFEISKAIEELKFLTNSKIKTYTRILTVCSVLLLSADDNDREILINGLIENKDKVKEIVKRAYDEVDKFTKEDDK